MSDQAKAPEMGDKLAARNYAEGKELATQREWSAYGDVRMESFLEGIKRGEEKQQAKVKRLRDLVEWAHSLFMNIPYPKDHKCSNSEIAPVEECMDCYWEHNVDQWLEKEGGAPLAGKEGKPVTRGPLEDYYP